MSPIERRSNYAGGEAHVRLDPAAHRKVSRDPLTGVLNPLAFLAITEYTLERAERADRDVAMLFVNLSNPTRELVGDERLFQLVARFLRRSTRGEDAIGRMGNAFLVLAADADEKGALVVNARLSEGLWHNLGLAIAGRWDVVLTMSHKGESARQFLERATAGEPGLCDSWLPRERRSFLRLLQKG